jgi:hypothetical protein
MTSARFRWVGAGFALAVCIGLSGPSAVAHAFCRETTKTKSDGPCVEEPDAERLVWRRSCMTYEFNDQLFERLPLLDEDSVRGEFQRSFDTWSDVDCGDDRAPFFVEQAPGVTSTDTSEFVPDEPNQSVIVARTKAEWVEHELASNVIALTVLWHDRDTGEIFDVDMQLNLGIGDFTDCRDKCGPGEVDLRNTITHEAGHLLGLGHSTVAGSTMFDNNARPGDIEKRTLAPDDEAGYCSLDLPSYKCKGGDCTCPAPKIISSTRTVKTCGCDVPGAARGPGLFASLLAALVLVVMARRVSSNVRRASAGGRRQRGKSAA